MDPFDQFWLAYPSRGLHRNPKAPARKSFLKATPGLMPTNPQDIIDGAKRYGEAMRKTGKYGTEFVAQAVTFLNQRGWEDYPLPPPQNLTELGFYAQPDSPELAAWDEFKLKTEGRKWPRDRNGGWHVPSRWPSNLDGDTSK